MNGTEPETILAAAWAAAGGRDALPGRVTFAGKGDLPSVFRVSDLAAASVAAAGLAITEWITATGGGEPALMVDRRLASFWFASSVRPQGWAPPPPWDPIAGDYRTADGWIRLHTNAPAHRAAALGVLQVSPTRDDVARAVAERDAETLEAEVVGAGGCAAQMRSVAEWEAHPQGRAVAAEPIIAVSRGGAAARPTPAVDAARPLRGIRVLDLTRVLAGPVATRFLAGFGAEVLRIDPPGWDEPAVVPEVMVGKTTARLDLRSAHGHALFLRLLEDADVLVHGLRPDALDALGLGAERRAEVRPDLVDVALDAYGWTGPWKDRRGFDSLVQMSAGIADAGMRDAGQEKPKPLPVQALDHATGYFMAAAAVRGLTQRHTAGHGSASRLSLARTARLLIESGHPNADGCLLPESEQDTDGAVRQTGWGPARRLRAPLSIAGAPMWWEREAVPIGTDAARWR